MYNLYIHAQCSILKRTKHSLISLHYFGKILQHSPFCLHKYLDSTNISQLWTLLHCCPISSNYRVKGLCALRGTPKPSSLKRIHKCFHQKSTHVTWQVINISASLTSTQVQCWRLLVAMRTESALWHHCRHRNVSDNIMSCSNIVASEIFNIQ